MKKVYKPINIWYNEVRKQIAYSVQEISDFVVGQSTILIPPSQHLKGWHNDVPPG